MAKHGMRGGKSYKAQYKSYKANNNFERNKLRKLEKTIKAQPNNEMAKAALSRLLNKGCVYNRNANDTGNPCKGRSSIFGWINNHANKDNKYKIVFSKIWHTSTNFSNWFNASVGKDTKVTESKSIWEQLGNNVKRSRK